MQNDVLKNNIAPWQEKGRWYHGIIDCTTYALDNDNSDEYLKQFSYSAVGQNIALRLNYPTQRALDVRYKLSDNYIGSGTTGYMFAAYYTNAGLQFPYVGLVGSAGKSEFWIFIVED